MFFRCSPHMPLHYPFFSLFFLAKPFRGRHTRFLTVLITLMFASEALKVKAPIQVKVDIRCGLMARVRDLVVSKAQVVPKQPSKHRGLVHKQGQHRHKYLNVCQERRRMTFAGESLARCEDVSMPCLLLEITQNHLELIVSHVPPGCSNRIQKHGRGCVVPGLSAQRESSPQSDQSFCFCSYHATCVLTRSPVES